MDRVVSAFEVRRQFGRILNDVAGKHDRVVVERHGEPVAALVPIAVYRQWQRQRAAFFDHMRETAERVDLSPEDAEAEVRQAIASVRAERSNERTDPLGDPQPPQPGVGV